MTNSYKNITFQRMRIIFKESILAFLDNIRKY